MKKIILFLWITLFLSCFQKKSPTNSKVEADLKVSNSLYLKSKLEDLFGKVDSTKILHAVGCTQGYFAYVSAEFVLRIPASIYSEMEGEKEFNLERDGIQCDLFVFEKDSSHLANICTDIILTNYPTHKRKLKSIQGDIKVFMGNKEELWGKEINNAYIKIENMEFVDSINHRKIVIKDKYLWDVLNLGLPG